MANDEEEKDLGKVVDTSVTGDVKEYHFRCAGDVDPDDIHEYSVLVKGDWVPEDRKDGIRTCLYPGCVNDSIRLAGNEAEVSKDKGE